MDGFAAHWQRRLGDRLAQREEVERNKIYTELWAGAGHRPDEVRAALRELECVFGVHPGRLRVNDALTLLFDPVEAGWNPFRRFAFRGIETAAATQLSESCRERMRSFRTLEAWDYHEIATIGDWVSAWSGKLPDGRIPPERCRPMRQRRPQIDPD